MDDGALFRLVNLPTQTLGHAKILEVVYRPTIVFVLMGPCCSCSPLTNEERQRY